MNLNENAWKIRASMISSTFNENDVKTIRDFTSNDNRRVVRYLSADEIL